MDRLVAARKLVAELVKEEQLEVRRAELIGRDLATWCDQLARTPTGHELEDWLADHPQVIECYANAGVLDDLLYRHFPPPPAPPMEEAHNRELEQQLKADPDSRDAYLVYADFLQSHNDPLGELIALGVAATDGNDDAVTRFERARKSLEPRLIPIASQLVDKATLIWRYGVVHAIEELAHQRPTLVLWEQLLKLRVCELVTRVTLRHRCTEDLDQLIADYAAPTLHTLALEACQGPLPERVLDRPLRSLSITGSQVMIQKLPNGLDRLDVRATSIADGSLTTFDVHELHLAVSEPGDAFFASIKLPRAERLSVTAPRALDLLRAIDSPALVELSISGGGFEVGAWLALGELPVASRLTSLALTDVELTDETVGAMASHGRVCPALERIDVSFNELTRDGLAAARALAPQVISSRQYRRGNAAEKRIRRFARSRLQVAEDIAAPKLWRDAGIDGDIRWARYRGDAEYELFVTSDLARYGCSCPSSIQPCKHVVALALVAERTALPVAPSGGIEARVERTSAIEWTNVDE